MLSLSTFLSALLPTIVIEMLVLLFLLERRRSVLLGSVGINVFTNVPLTYWVITSYPSWTAIIIAEILICLIEAGLYRLLRCDTPQALAYGFLCNAISFLTGLVAELLCLILDIRIPLILDN